MQTWERYEDAARAAIKAIADELGLETVVDGKQVYQGDSTTWELDVTAYAKGSGQLVAFECRKRRRNVEKGEMGSFAYTVGDLGAKGFIVSQKQLGKGATEIAAKRDIGHVLFLWNADTGDNVLRWLNILYASLSSHIDFKQSADVTLVRASVDLVVLVAAPIAS